MKNNRLDNINTQLDLFDKSYNTDYSKLRTLIRNTLNVATDILVYNNQPYSYFKVLFNAIRNKPDPRIVNFQLALTDVERKLQKMQEIIGV